VPHQAASNRPNVCCRACPLFFTCRQTLSRAGTCKRQPTAIAACGISAATGQAARNWPGLLRLFTAQGAKLCAGLAPVEPPCSLLHAALPCAYMNGCGLAQTACRCAQDNPWPTRHLPCLLPPAIAHLKRLNASSLQLNEDGTPTRGPSQAGVAMLSAEGASTCIQAPCSMASATLHCHPSCACNCLIPEAARPCP
jgi:hypothetical protein